MSTNKKTKIVCTIGPVSTDRKVLKSMALAGMNIARHNFAYDNFKIHQDRVDKIESITKETGLKVQSIQDLSGPKIRIGEFDKEFVYLKEGQFFTFTTKKIVGDETKVFINYPPFPKEIKVGNMVLVNDGKKKLQVVKISGTEVVCKVIVGGPLGWKRGVNLPGAKISAKSLTDKDRENLVFGIKNKVDYIALSFVRDPNDILELRKILKKEKSKCKIMAKIETPQAVKKIDEIISLSDAIMIARGDLAMEILPEDVPIIQKMIIKKCNKAGKFVITATQMLDSMSNSPIPTRAEVSDVANAILDGTDAVMLSDETTLGKYPLQSIEVMAQIVKKIDRYKKSNG